MLDPMRLCKVLAITGILGCSASNERGGDDRSQDTLRAQQQDLQATSDRTRGINRLDSLRNEQRAPHDSSDVGVPLHFKPVVGESTAVVRALNVAMQRPNGPQMRQDEIRGQVFRLDPTPGKRYLLYAAQPRFTGPDGAHWGRSFYVLDLSGGVGLSPPLDMKDAETSGSRPYGTSTGMGSSIWSTARVMKARESHPGI